MSKGKMFKFGTQGAISFWVSDAWYEEIDGTKCYQHLAITHRKKDGYLLISAVLLFFKVTLFIKSRNPSNAKRDLIKRLKETMKII